MAFPVPRPIRYSPPGAHERGEWFCGAGPYLDHVRHASGLHPNLRLPDPRNRALDFQRRTAQATLLEFKDAKEPPLRTDFGDADALQEHFGRPTAARRIYLVQGLSPAFVSVLGHELRVDPMFFVEHERTSTCLGWPNECNLAPQLPSLMNANKSFSCSYYDIRWPDPEIHQYRVACAQTGRDGLTNRLRRQWEKTVILNQKCSVWTDVRNDDEWNVLILCDPPFRSVHTWHREEPSKDWDVHTTRVASMPFQGGYADFVPRSLLDIPNGGPSRQCMSEDLCYYLTEATTCLPGGIQSPADATIFLKKIIASQYLLLIAYTEAILYKMESPLQMREDFHEIETASLEGQWSDIQLVCSRCNRYVKDVEFLLLQLGIPIEHPHQRRNASWTDSTVDFQYVYMRLTSLKERAEALNSALTGLTGIIGNARALTEARRSIREAKTVKTLTLIAMIFVPLAFTTGLFSMSDEYLPGRSSFWVYFVVSVPIVVVVFFVAMLIDLGYDANGNWSIVTFLVELLRLRGYLRKGKD